MAGRHSFKRPTLLQILALLPIPVVLVLVLATGKAPPPLPVEKLGGSGEDGAAGARAAAGAGLRLPAVVDGKWKVQGEVTRYNQKTLFDRINGAAPAYIRAGYVASWGAEYARAGLAEPVVVDVYDMGSPARALGMYATERDTSYTFVEVGAEGYMASGSLNYWKSRYYVKMAGFEEGEAMDRALMELGRGLAEALPGSAGTEKLLAPLSRLPEAGRVPHTAGYSHPPLADIEGLSEVFYVDAEVGEEGRVRLLATAKESAGKLGQRYGQVKSYFQKDGAQVTESAEGELRLLTARGQSTVTLIIQAPQVLVGAVDLEQQDQLPAIRDTLVAGLTGKRAEGTSP